MNYRIKIHSVMFINLVINFKLFNPEYKCFKISIDFVMVLGI